jgi:hypothetical protein
MKYMGWSWLDYCYTPAEIIGGVIDLINEEAQEQELKTA